MSDASDNSDQLRYRRVILKLSGESLADSGGRGISGEEAGQIAQQIKQAHASGCQIAIVIGGGNILRGAQFSGSNALVQEATAHYMGMLATLVNSLAMQDAIESLGLQTRVMSAIPVDKIAETFIRRRAIRHLEKGRVVILAAGIGNPFVTTDTAAAQRALEFACRRSVQRETFGRKLSEHQSVLEDIANSWSEIEQARLLTLKTARRMDEVGAKDARDLIAASKITVPLMAQRVIDRCMQIHGAGGLTADYPMAEAFNYARWCRQADGPDQVHMMALGKQLVRRYA